MVEIEIDTFSETVLLTSISFNDTKPIKSKDLNLAISSVGPQTAALTLGRKINTLSRQQRSESGMAGSTDPVNTLGLVFGLIFTLIFCGAFIVGCFFYGRYRDSIEST